MQQRQYIAIDLKSFYASVECIERNLNPLDTCLVVADKSRTDKTICLAVSPALKSYGIPGRPRLFEVIKKIRNVNRTRGHLGSSISLSELNKNHDLMVDYIVASPHMQLYLDYSTRIYGIYLKYISPEDIHVYSIDEVFIDVTDYLYIYKISAHELTLRIISDILNETGITATAGIGTNLYLCKIAMDIVAKKMTPDKNGMRIAELDEISYRHLLWNHTPLTDFWRIGAGIARRLESAGIHTMGDIARCSLTNEDRLYDLFGINAELIIDHAWGWEPVTMAMVKAYHSDSHSISSGQVLHSAYTYDNAKTVIREMADSVALNLVEKRLVTNQIVLTVGYDIENLANQEISSQYHGKIVADMYGRTKPQHAHGTINFEHYTSSSDIIVDNTTKLFERIVNPMLLIRRITLSINRLIPESKISDNITTTQLDLFTDYDELNKKIIADKVKLARERRRQETIINIRKQFGKNAILKGLNYADGATQRDRNQQIGGHKA